MAAWGIVRSALSGIGNFKKGEKMRDAYKNSGVDVEAGYEVVERIKSHATRSKIGGVMGGLGGFGALFDLNAVGAFKEPVLVSGTDGVGTKLKLAFLLDKHDTVGIDCVAMCVNDVVCGGAKPLFFLDYIAVGKNIPTQIESIVKGIADGCVSAGCALTGGETAEMPGFYAEGEYDVAGFCVGVVEKSRILSPKNVTEGDAVLALPSSGAHSNGFSLIRRIFELNGEANKARENLAQRPQILGGRSIGEALLEPTKIYVKEVLTLFEAGILKSAAHITGGGFFENIPRALPENLGVKIELGKVKTLPIFTLLQERSNLATKEMYATFNMGVAMSLIVSKKDLDTVLSLLPQAYVIGEVVASSGVHLV